ncbi:odorant receptor 9a-like [Leptopilina heterotoma]|uniref:odorant receptor 9a-like n=1 Tax=Leptopilina heterotoma TaxID=63436 RepID=UPI001CA99869|nr:odorant receptor 9a-like [Leptopilina heterotoma]
MKQLLEDMIEDWEYWSPKPEIEILQKYAMEGRTITIAYATYIYSTAIAFVNLPMIPVILDLVKPLNVSRPKTPLYIAEYYIDEEKYFFPIMLHQYACSITCTNMIVVVETMFMLYTQHACGIFSILGYKLQHLVEPKNVDRIRLRKDIAFCVEMHRKVVKFVDNINASFSTGFFIIMGLNTVLMSVTGVQTALKIGQPREGSRYALFTASQMFHFFFLSVPGQKLIDHSLEVQKYIYNSPWYELPVEAQKLLLFMMRKTSEPCEFVAGVLFQFSMQTFASVVRMSMSYFTVLSSVN